MHFWPETPNCSGRRQWTFGASHHRRHHQGPIPPQHSIISLQPSLSPSYLISICSGRHDFSGPAIAAAEAAKSGIMHAKQQRHQHQKGDPFFQPSLPPPPPPCVRTRTLPPDRHDLPRRRRHRPPAATERRRRRRRLRPCAPSRREKRVSLPADGSPHLCRDCRPVSTSTAAVVWPCRRSPFACTTNAKIASPPTHM